MFQISDNSEEIANATNPVHYCTYYKHYKLLHSDTKIKNNNNNKNLLYLGMVAHALNPSIQKAEADRSL